jgi:hypothetical protein
VKGGRNMRGGGVLTNVVPILGVKIVETKRSLLITKIPVKGFDSLLQVSLDKMIDYCSHVSVAWM